MVHKSKIKENVIIKTKQIDTKNFDDALKVQNDSTKALFQAQQNMKDLGETLENAPFIH